MAQEWKVKLTHAIILSYWHLVCCVSKTLTNRLFRFRKIKVAFFSYIIKNKIIKSCEDDACSCNIHSGSDFHPCNGYLKLWQAIFVLRFAFCSWQMTNTAYKRMTRQHVQWEAKRGKPDTVKEGNYRRKIPSYWTHFLWCGRPLCCWTRK